MFALDVKLNLDARLGTLLLGDWGLQRSFGSHAPVTLENESECPVSRNHQMPAVQCSVLSVEHGNSHQGRPKRPGFATSCSRPRLSWRYEFRLVSEVTPDIEYALARAGGIGVPEPRYSET